MNNFKKLLVLILPVAIILPVAVLSSCAGSDELNKGGQSPVTPSRTSPPITMVAPTQAMLQLAFAGNRNGKYALFVINIDGSGEKQICYT